MQLSPEERHKICEEEKVRIEAEQKQRMTEGGSSTGREPNVAGLAACCALLAECLDLPKSRVSVLRGETGRQKRLRIRTADTAQVLVRLQSR